MENNNNTGEFNLKTNNVEVNESEGTPADDNYDTPVNDEYVIGSGFVIDEEPVIPVKKRKKSKGVVRSLIWIFSILLISGTLAVSAIFFVIDYMGIGSSKTVTVTIDEGESLDSIISELKSTGAIRFKFLFKYYVNSKDYYKNFQAGVHTFKTDSGYQGIVNEFTTVPGFSTKTATITIPEMASIDDIAEIFDKKNICSKEDFIDVVQNTEFDYKFLDDIPTKSVHYRLEGYLYPDTYEFYVWDSKDGAEQAVKKMLDNFESKIEDEYYEEAEKMGYTFHEIVTMASIVELECNGYPDEMPKVAAVFYNRLLNWGDQPKTLGSSPTADYPYGGGNYNTNIKEGLPPGPFCATGINAIKAALHPNKKFDNKYFYFVTDTDFNFYYNENLTAHNYTIDSLRAKDKWGED